MIAFDSHDLDTSSISPTLLSGTSDNKARVPCVCYAEKRFFEWHEDDLSVTIRNRGGGVTATVRK